MKHGKPYILFVSAPLCADHAGRLRSFFRRDYNLELIRITKNMPYKLHSINQFLSDQSYKSCSFGFLLILIPSERTDTEQAETLIQINNHS